MDERIIVLLTDFGCDFYVGQMKGVIKRINPKAHIIDLSNNIVPHQIRQAAVVLEASYKYFPKGSIFVCVVDPEVGSKRDIILLKKNDYVFLAPNNGLLSLLVKNEDKIYRIYNRKFFLKEISYTFHGRDIIAPVAAYLSKGIKIKSICKIFDRKNFVNIDFPEIKTVYLKGKKFYLGNYLFHDHFGNIITNLKGEFLNKDRDNFLFIILKNKLIKKIQIKNTYCEVKKGEFLCLVNSLGFIEVAINRENAYYKFLEIFKHDPEEFGFLLEFNE